jgi:hypothetical protein
MTRRARKWRRELPWKEGQLSSGATNSGTSQGRGNARYTARKRPRNRHHQAEITLYHLPDLLVARVADDLAFGPDCDAIVPARWGGCDMERCPFADSGIVMD